MRYKTFLLCSDFSFTCTIMTMNLHILQRLIFTASGIFFLTAGAWAQQGNPVQSTTDSIITEHGYLVLNYRNTPGIRPVVGDMVSIHVSLWLNDTLLQDTRKIVTEPREVQIPDFREMPAGSNVPAIFDGLLWAAEGDSISVFQSADSDLLAKLPAGSKYKNEKWMRFDLVLFKIVTAEEMKRKQENDQNRYQGIVVAVDSTVRLYRTKKLDKKITTLPSGLKVLIMDKGSGGPLKVQSQVKIHYYGCLKNGKMFDNSFQRGLTFDFMLDAGQVIAGFDEGVQQLNHGGKAYLFIPPNLGYGDQVDENGPIPPNAELIFYVEVE